MDISKEARSEELKEFVRETLVRWHGKIARDIHLLPCPIPPRQIGYQELNRNPNKTKFGVYILNPETICLDWRSIAEEKIKVFELKEMLSRSFAEVAEYAIAKYGATHHLPGIEYMCHTARNPGDISALLKDGNYYFLFGSIIYDSTGVARVPCMHWRRRYLHIGDGEWCRCAGRIDRKWESNDRVLMAEK